MSAASSRVQSAEHSSTQVIGASAMAGALGGGGLGDLAIRYGYQRFQMDVMIATVIVLIVMVQGVQTVGNALSRKLNKNKLS